MPEKIKSLFVFLFMGVLVSGFWFSRQEIKHLDINAIQRSMVRMPASDEIFPKVTVDAATGGFYRIIDRENGVICYGAKENQPGSFRSISCVKN